MANNYSKNQMKTLTIDTNDEVRVYKGFKLNSRQVMLEGFKLLKVLLPSLGTGIDQMTNKENDVYGNMPDTFGAMLQLLNENLTEEQFTDLVDKLLGSLICNSEAIDDWVVHFDTHPQDLIEVIAWAGGANFHDFFMESTILKSKVKGLMSLIDPNLLEKMKNGLSFNEPDTKENA